MKNLEVKIKNIPDFLEVGQLYSVINKDSDVCVNGSVTVTGKIPSYLEESKVRIYCNLCDATGRILYVLSDYSNTDIFKNNYFVFSMSCAKITRFLELKNLEYVEIYAIFKEDEE